MTFKIRPTLACLRATLRNRAERVMLPERQLACENNAWTAPVSLLQSPRASVEVTIAPERIVSSDLYAPDANGCWVEYTGQPHPLEEASSSDIAGTGSPLLRPLVFDHLSFPPNGADPFTKDGAHALRRRIGLFAASGLMLRYRQPCQNSSAARAFLDLYPDIPGANAWFLRPALLGVHLPFKHSPFCIWVDRVGKKAAPRLFSQPLSQDGYPVGAAQSRPLNAWTIRDAMLDLPIYHEGDMPC